MAETPFSDVNLLHDAIGLLERDFSKKRLQAACVFFGVEDVDANSSVKTCVKALGTYYRENYDPKNYAAEDAETTELQKMQKLLMRAVERCTTTPYLEFIPNISLDKLELQAKIEFEFKHNSLF